MTDYNEDRRLFHAMKAAGWTHDLATGGFTRIARPRDGWLPGRKRLWVSWGQAADALRLADDGEPVQGVAPMSREAAAMINSAENDNLTKTQAETKRAVREYREMVAGRALRVRDPIVLKPAKP